MASVEQKGLAEDVKSVHRKLREQLLEGGEPNEVWAKHMQDLATLDKYSKSMKSLATSYWEKSGEESRVEWVKNQVESYFWADGEEREKKRDQKRLIRSQDNNREGEVVATGLLDKSQDLLNRTVVEAKSEITPLQVLDVGSCYNPFGEFENWQVLPLDIAPATPCVKFCDFLNVDLAPETLVEDCGNRAEVKCLKRAGYHVVIFCLLLEYLPSADLRLKAVEKAVEALMEGGVLCIITPDSCHQARNSDQLSSWKLGLGLLGLSKVTYTKSKHFHGLVYRKPSLLQMHLIKNETKAGPKTKKEQNKSPFIEQDLEESQSRREQLKTQTIEEKHLESLFFIPQDFSTQVNPEQSSVKIELSVEERLEMVESFSDLPMDL